MKRITWLTFQSVWPKKDFSRMRVVPNDYITRISRYEWFTINTTQTDQSSVGFQKLVSQAIEPYPKWPNAKKAWNPSCSHGQGSVLATFYPTGFGDPACGTLASAELCAAEGFPVYLVFLVWESSVYLVSALEGGVFLRRLCEMLAYAGMFFSTKINPL